MNERTTSTTAAVAIRRQLLTTNARLIELHEQLNLQLGVALARGINNKTAIELLATLYKEIGQQIKANLDAVTAYDAALEK